jgi:hypothetical protein
MPHDQETQVRQISVVLTKEKSETGKAPEFGNVQKGGSRKHEQAVQYFKRH